MAAAAAAESVLMNALDEVLSRGATVVHWHDLACMMIMNVNDDDNGDNDADTHHWVNFAQARRELTRNHRHDSKK